MLEGREDHVAPSADVLFEEKKEFKSRKRG